MPLVYRAKNPKDNMCDHCAKAHEFCRPDIIEFGDDGREDNVVACNLWRLAPSYCTMQKLYFPDINYKPKAQQAQDWRNIVIDTPEAAERLINALEKAERKAQQGREDA